MLTVKINAIDGKTYLVLTGPVTRRYSIMGSEGETTSVRAIGTARITKKGELSRWSGSDNNNSWAARGRDAWIAAGKPATFETVVYQ